MSTWRSILFSAVFFTPLAVGGCALFAILMSSAVRDGAGGGDIFLLVIVGIVTVLLLFQSISALRDLRTEVTNSEGTVTHKWSRSDFILFGDSCFIRVARPAPQGDGIFKIDRFWWEQINDGDRVLVKHYPHTASVESVEKL